MDPISKSITVHRTGKDLSGPNTLAYWAHLEVMDKGKACEYSSRDLLGWGTPESVS